MRTQIKIEVLAIEDDGFHLFLEAEINGRSSRLLIDTGASRTVFDRERASRFLDQTEAEAIEHEKLSTGLGTSEMKSYVTTLDSLCLGDLSLPDYEAILIDMAHVNGSYEKLEIPLIDGVLGGDILKKHQATIDYRNKLLRLSFSKKE